MERTVAWRVVLSVLLVVVAAWDLKTKRVPHLVAWPLLLVATATRVWEGSWTLPFFLLGLILVDVLPQVWRGPGIALLVGGAQWGAGAMDDPATGLVALWWGVACVLWRLHVLGGGDARILMALRAFFPHPGMVAALWGGLALVGIVWLVVLHRHSALGLLMQAGEGITGGRYPSLEDLARQGRPTTPGLVAGALVYLWLMV